MHPAGVGTQRIHYPVRCRKPLPADMATVLKNLLIAVLMLAAACPLSAQSFDYGFKHLTTDQGLSHDNIHCITKDKQGFMWFGTMNGLNRFDGVHFRNYTNRAGDSTSLIHNYVTTVICDDDGYLWIGTGEGICRYDPYKEEFRRLEFPGGKADAPLSQVMRATNGRIFATRNRTLYEIDAKKFTVRIIKKLGPDSEHTRLFPARDGQIWVLQRMALYLCNTKNFDLEYIMGVDDAHRTATPGVLYVYTDPIGKTWIGTWEAGLYYLDEKTRRPVSFPGSVPFIVSIIADLNYSQNHLLWMSAGYAGLLQLDVQTGRIIDMPKNIQQPWSHNGGRINTFYADSATDILWLGSDFGIEKYDPGTEHFARKVLPATGAVGQFPAVNAVIKDKTDTSGRTWWISSWVGGFFKWNRATDELTSYSHKLRTSEIFDLQQDDDGNIWIAEWRGVQIFNPRTGSMKLIDSFIRNDTISSKVLRLFKDRRGNMWIAPNYNGLLKYDKRADKIVRYELSSLVEGMKTVWISSISEDGEGNILASNVFQSFSIAPDGTARVLKIKPGNHDIRSSGALGITVDKKNNIWLAHQDKLVNITKDGEVLKVYNQQNGLIGSTLRWLLTDPEGFIWLATENSLHRLNPSTGHFRYYKKEDGLFNNNVVEPMCISEEGELFVGFHNAFSYTNVLKLNHRVTVVPFIITSIQIEDRRVSAINTTDVTLSPGENTLNVEFAALDFSKPEKIQYVYWLEGADKQWHFTSQRSLTFTNLSGGNYILHLKVQGPSGIISKEELTLHISVIPPFYRTWWFWGLIALGAGALLYAFYRIRKQQRTRLEKIRDRIATDLHDDMGSTLSSIRIFSDVARNQLNGSQPQVVPMLEKISDNASQLSDNMQDIIWTIKQDHDKLEDLVTRIREFGLKLCDAKDITFKVHISDSFKTSRLDLEQKRNLYLIFKECLNNAIKYSNCSIIQLFITQQRKHLKMVIEDNGKGFSESNIAKGNGLSNIRKRAVEINGNATIESLPGKGTRIDILVNLD